MSNDGIMMLWDGEAMRPKDLAHARHTYHVGRTYSFRDDERSRESHNQFFDVVAFAFDTLPEGHAFTNPEHLRKWALVRRGYYTATPVLLPTEEEAERTAHIIEMLMPADDYIEFVVNGPLLTIVKPLSQSVKAMGGKKFQQSKQDVLAYIANYMLDVPLDDLMQMSKRAA